ncbi:MAG: branched-chain amino acid aminotransferase [Traorella sp.]
MEIKFEKRTTLKEKPSQEQLGFGKYFTDYMFVMEHSQGKWHDARIIPYGPLPLDPASMVLHYAQETFEGLKAYRTKNNDIQLFRVEMNAQRMKNSNKRLCMPTLPEEDFIEACMALVKVEKDWVPEGVGKSLYLRPFMYATEAGVGVHASLSYQFIIIASPVASYYENGLKPVNIYVEDEYVRASPGGTGSAKCGGNYASSIIAQVKAQNYDCQQVLWLDGVERKYIEEVGTMNVMFVIDNTLYTPPLKGTILPGITRDSILHLAKDYKIPVKEERMDIDTLMQLAKENRIQEAFGCGTAAVITPIGELVYKDERVEINHHQIGTITQFLYDTLTAIQWGEKEDPYHWTRKI